MKKIKFLSSAKKEVKTEVTIQKDHVEYNCPECGQKIKAGINGNKDFKISYPNDTTIEKKLDHTHIYPAYVDVEFFSSRGMEIPATTFREKMNRFTKLIIKRIKGM